AHRTVGVVALKELAWLASHGSVRHMNAGDVLTSKNARPDGLFVVLSGRIAITVDRGAGPHKVMEWRGGDVTRLPPHSPIGRPPGAPAYLAHGKPSRRYSRPGANHDPRRSPRRSPRDDPRVP